jgi:rhodanese-related sulfurtransferase
MLASAAEGDFEEDVMAKTFMQMVEEAKAEVSAVSAQEAQRQMQQDANTVVVDVRDADEVRQSGALPGALNISLGILPVRADQQLPEQLRNPKLQDRSRPVITTCALGLNAARGAKVLKDMGFTNVRYIEGGFKAWKEAGLPTDRPA